MHLELCRGYKQGPGELSEYVPKVSQSWRVAGDNQDDWEDGTRYVCARLLLFPELFIALYFIAGTFRSAGVQSKISSTTRSSEGRTAGTMAIFLPRAARAAESCRHPLRTGRKKNGLSF